MSKDREARLDERAHPDQAGGPRPQMERVTVNLTARASEALRESVEVSGDTKTDTINRALLVYAFLQGVMREGGAVYTKSGDTGELERVRFL
ncbi:hypothetical protein ACRYCC_39535 [Actinomadura scrupuli]|uniref:hypothetical protein n=1 Tax=Actinomadura scrupuli TaxID=559629 RepID=UPI003D9791C8